VLCRIAPEDHILIRPRGHGRQDRTGRIHAQDHGKIAASDFSVPLSEIKKFVIPGSPTILWIRLSDWSLFGIFVVAPLDLFCAYWMQSAPAGHQVYLH